ncbi:general secretion pathway protein GspK [Microvirga sp. BT689]|uniref:type II secretion system protein GspK n=1 Tax=Microvirga arvi TaxID=2778731 RepID=UPI00194F7E31|nr:type II secretion system protein GspK [Microvirga arvi]MBM6582476.1 general secretion pathway protein GspK [Microvirga arvi]
MRATGLKRQRWPHCSQRIRLTSASVVDHKAPIGQRLGRPLIGAGAPPATSQDGFALVSVIWAIGVLSLLFVTYIAAARYRAIEALHLAERARAEMLARAGIAIGLLDLLAKPSSAASSGRFGRDGRPVLCTLGGSRVAISVADEGGKIDINTAAPALLARVLSRLSPDVRTGSLVVKGILELREAASAAQRARGIASPDATAFRTILEFDQVPGVDQRLFRAMMPLVTAHSGSLGFDAEVAPVAVLAAVMPDGASVSRSEAGGRLPPSYLAASAGKTFVVGSEVLTGLAGHYSQEAVVELSNDVADGYTIREWRTGFRRDLAQPIARASAC